jgi:two-component system, chemotaxis family, sensor kinase Cph1
MTSDADHDCTDREIERLRKALDAETEACIALQRQLDRAGKQTEEFVSTAAHNLRESLRDIAAYSQLMVETYAGRLDSDADAFLGRIQAGAADMESLVAGMVDFWTTDRGGLKSGRTNMEAVLRQALLVTAELIKERGAMVSHDPLPEVTGDFEVLAKVLHHLIRNAIEYRGTAPGRVHISCRQVDYDWVFSVQDNGCGVDPAFHERVFGAFTRLHGREHPGHGLGLAFCRKAIGLSGGRMWLESVSGAGSTFYFSLPQAGSVLI